MLPPKNTPDLEDKLNENTTESQEISTFDEVMLEIKNSEEFKKEAKAFEEALSPEETQALSNKVEELQSELFELIDARNNGGSLEPYEQGFKEVYEKMMDLIPDDIENVMTKALEEKYDDLFNAKENNSAEIIDADNEQFASLKEALDLDNNSMEIINIKDVEVNADEISSPNDTPAVERANNRDIEI